MVGSSVRHEVGAAMRLGLPWGWGCHEAGADMRLGLPWGWESLYNTPSMLSSPCLAKAAFLLLIKNSNFLSLCSFLCLQTSSTSNFITFLNSLSISEFIFREDELTSSMYWVLASKNWPLTFLTSNSASWILTFIPWLTIILSWFFLSISWVPNPAFFNLVNKFTVETLLLSLILLYRNLCIARYTLLGCEVLSDKILRVAKAFIILKRHLVLVGDPFTTITFFDWGKTSETLCFYMLLMVKCVFTENKMTKKLQYFFFFLLIMNKWHYSKTVPENGSRGWFWPKTKCAHVFDPPKAHNWP